MIRSVLQTLRLDLINFVTLPNNYKKVLTIQSLVKSLI